VREPIQLGLNNIKNPSVITLNIPITHTHKSSKTSAMAENHALELKKQILESKQYHTQTMTFLRTERNPYNEVRVNK